MGGRSGLGEFEQLVLLVIVRLGEDAFGPEIAQELDRSVGRSVTRGALYSTLNRLEGKGLLRWEAQDPGEGRKSQVRRCFRVTDAGLEVLRLRRQALLTLWDGIEGVLAGGSE